MANEMMSAAAAQISSGLTVENLRLAAATVIQVDVDDYEAERTTVAGVGVEWLRANGVAKDAPVVVYLHGGAFMSGAPEAFRNTTVWLSRIAQVRILAPDYRLAPEHPFPAAFDDSLAVYRWLVNEGGEDPQRIALVGDSAGGSIAVSIAADAAAEGLPKPSCIVANSPYADMTGASPSLDDPRCNQSFPNRAMIEWLLATYIGANNADPKNPRHSPVYRDLSGLPPLLVQVGGLDNLHDDGLRLAAQARSCGVDVTFTDYVFCEHIWIVNRPANANSWVRLALEEMRDFLAVHIADRSVTSV